VKTEAGGSRETLVTIYQRTWYHIPKYHDANIQSSRLYYQLYIALSCTIV